jgi:hypothetical protein
VTDDEAWYRERPEPQGSWSGVLRRREVVTSPGGRDRLLFELEQPDGERLVIYGPPAEGVLELYVDGSVRLDGKLVDLTGEGLGRELWIARPDAVHDASGSG